jgi:L-ascorbate metabolism protein UlaG (beta-lactamase superfamily)
MELDRDPPTPTTRLAFLSVLTRRAAQAVPLPVPPAQAPPVVETAPELPPAGTLIEPYLCDDAFLEDVESARQEVGLHLWWLGQSGFLVQADGEHLLLDPYLSDTLTEQHEGTDTPHERLTRRVIAPGRISFVDVVTSSHGHTGHLDPGTLPGVLAGGAELVCAAGSEALAEERSGHHPAAVLAAGDSVQIGGFHIEAVPAHHEGAPEAVGYLVRNGSFALYHAGDTRRVQGIAEAISRHAVDIAIVPVNGRFGNMDGADAARLAHEARARLAVPCHYEMFRCNTASPARFVAECVRLRQEYRLCRAGERLTVRPLKLT